MVFERKVLLLLLAAVLGDDNDSSEARAETFKLTIVHTNDVHAHFVESDAYGNACKEGGPCYGGAARRATLINEIRANRQNPVLLLDAGDQSQGTPWYNTYKGAAAANFISVLGYDAFIIGNHEFDRGVENFIEHFIGNISSGNEFPILSANIDAKNEPSLIEKFDKTLTIDIEGLKIGVIGYTTEETPEISDTGNLIFNNVVKTVQEESTRLRSENADILIGVGHYGLSEDKAMASQVDLDVIIGGHSHSLLYSDQLDVDPIDAEKSKGPYPTWEKNVYGNDLPICHAFEYGKYLGIVDLEFHLIDGKYVLQKDLVQGAPRILDQKIEKNKVVLAEIEEWKVAVDRLTEEPIGYAMTFLDGDRTSCRRRECTMGNWAADAVVHHQNRLYSSGSDAAPTACHIAMLGSGGIRASISAGKINYGQMLTVFPFDGFFDSIVVNGSIFRQTVETGVRRYVESADSNPGEFLQFSGVKVVYDMEKESFSRVSDLKVRTRNETTGELVYTDIEDEKEYCFVSSDFLAVKGGDGYDLLRDPAIQLTRKRLGIDIEITVETAKLFSPIKSSLEGRITFAEHEDGDDNSGGSASKQILFLILLLAALLV